MFLSHLHLTHQNVLFKKRADIQQVFWTFLFFFPFYLLVPSCQLSVPKVQCWFTALNPYAENQLETLQNKHALLWPPSETFCHFGCDILSLLFQFRVRVGINEASWKKEINFKKKKGKKKEMTNSLGMWCIGRILDQKQGVLRAAALSSNIAM